MAARWIEYRSCHSHHMGFLQVGATPAATRHVPSTHLPAPGKHPSPGPRPNDNFYPPADISNTPFRPDFSHLEGIATDLATLPIAQGAACPDVSPVYRCSSISMLFAHYLQAAHCLHAKTLDVLLEHMLCHGQMHLSCCDRKFCQHSFTH